MYLYPTQQILKEQQIQWINKFESQVVRSIEAHFEPIFQRLDQEIIQAKSSVDKYEYMDGEIRKMMKGLEVALDG
jgi:hypothetical protein